MRNPTSSIQFGLERILQILTDFDKRFKMVQKALDKDKNIAYEDMEPEQYDEGTRINNLKSSENKSSKLV